MVGYTEPVDENVEIVVPDDDYGLYALDILDPSLVSYYYYFLTIKAGAFLNFLGI